jgi:hypothetical protein
MKVLGVLFVFIGSSFITYLIVSWCDKVLKLLSDIHTELKDIAYGKGEKKGEA